MSLIQATGGTLVSDGAKNRRRNALNTSLQTSKGSYFVQSTDASGIYKSAEYLAEDIAKAYLVICIKNVFVLCMDGACEKTLRLVDAKYPKVFGQRCSTHGSSLLMSGIGGLFGTEVDLCARLLHFMVNHDAIFALLMKQQGSLMLLGVCETRFGSVVYSIERIVRDKEFIINVFTGQGLREILQQPSTKQPLRDEFEYLRANLVLKEEAWSRLEDACEEDASPHGWTRIKFT